MSSLRVFEQNISSTNSGFGLRKKSTFVLSKTIQTFSYSQSHFGWHFRKLKAPSYNVSFPMSKWKEKFEFWPVLKQHSKMSPQVGMTVLYGKVERKKQTHECTVVERQMVERRLTLRDHYQTKLASGWREETIIRPNISYWISRNAYCTRDHDCWRILFCLPFTRYQLPG